jgi:hypothetical protein
LRVGNCQDVLDRIKLKSLQELFEVMQEYCKSDKCRRRRLDRANAAKKQRHQGQWDTPKGWQNHPPKQSYRLVNNVSAPPDQNQSRNGGGHKGGHKNGRGPKPPQPPPPPQGAAKDFSVGSMGSMLTTTRITALRRSRRKWSGKLRKRRRQQG